MPLEHLWTGWRSEYVVSVPDDAGRDDTAPACVFCRILESGEPDESTYVVHRGEHCFVILNAYPYATGHQLVMPYRHVGQLGELTNEEHGELWDLWSRAAAHLEGVYGPEGFNLGMNLGRAGGAGIPGHLHAHVLPRWSGDTNFMTSVANARIHPEALELTWHKLHDAWSH